MPLSAPRQRRSAAVIAAVGAAALVAVAVGVALSARAQGRGELASHMEHYRLRCVLSRAIARCSAPALPLPPAPLVYAAARSHSPTPHAGTEQRQEVVERHGLVLRQSARRPSQVGGKAPEVAPASCQARRARKAPRQARQAGAAGGSRRRQPIQAFVQEAFVQGRSGFHS
jgi:hypothetical protein